MRVGRQVAEVMTIHGRDDDAAARAATDLLAQVRLPDPAGIARAYPHQLSGGQRQRVVLAIALANDPALLICDEPSTALDVTVQAQVLDLIVSGVEARDSALLFITHDLAVVATVCERVLVMYGGRVVEAGSVRDVLTAPRHPYTRGLLAASDLDQVDAAGRLFTVAGTVPPAGQFPSGCVFRNRCPRATPECAEVPPWTGSGPDDGFACFHPYDEAAPLVSAARTASAGGGQPDVRPTAADRPDRSAEREQTNGLDGSLGTATELIIEVRGLTRTYRRPRQSLLKPGAAIHALRGVDLQIRTGERFGIVGESGSGKSTLLRLLAAVDQPTAGTITVLGQPIVGRPERDLRFLRESLHLVFQDPSGSLDPRMRVRDIVAEPLVAQGHRRPYDRVRELLDAVGLSAASADRYPHQFSGGQRQRISLARALAPGPRILVADEPVSALDVSLRAQVLNLILDLVDRFELTLVFVSHDLAVVRHVCERVAVMHDGVVVESGATDQVYAHPRDPYTQQLVAAVPTLQRALAGETAADLARTTRGRS
jgi:peptide/nickel transport system ATP-binding protein